MISVTRLLTAEDAAELCALLIANHDFLKPWQPTRTREYFTVAGQETIALSSIAAYEAGSSVPLVVQNSDGAIVGSLAISGIVRGAFDSANIGYWESEAENGRGVATAAVVEAANWAFGELGLHRLQAGTLVHNCASQRALTANGFQQFGMAPQYLNIDGRWQDHLLYQLIRLDLLAGAAPHGARTPKP